MVKLDLMLWPTIDESMPFRQTHIKIHVLEEDPINLKFKNLVDLKTMEKVVKILLTLRIILHKQSLILESNHYLTHHHHLWMDTNQRLLLHNPSHLEGIQFESDEPILDC
jgi:hypothetical protein